MPKGVFETRTAIAKSNGETDSVIVHKFGAINDVTTTLTPVSSSGTYQTPATLTSLEIVSSDANDTSGGTGARTVAVTGLTTDYAEITETVSMNGTTAVALSNQFYRVYRIQVATSGTYATAAASSHAGTITVRTSGAGATWGLISIDAGFGLGQSEIGAYSVPAGKTAFLLTKTFDVESAKSASVYFFVREAIDTVSAPFSAMQTKQVHRNKADSLRAQPITPLGPFVGPADIGFMAKATTSTADVQVDFEVELIPSA